MTTVVDEKLKNYKAIQEGKASRMHLLGFPFIFYQRA